MTAHPRLHARGPMTDATLEHFTTEPDNIWLGYVVTEAIGDFTATSSGQHETSTPARLTGGADAVLRG